MLSSWKYLTIEVSESDRIVPAISLIYIFSSVHPEGAWRKDMSAGVTMLHANIRRNSDVGDKGSRNLFFTLQFQQSVRVGISQRPIETLERYLLDWSSRRSGNKMTDFVVTPNHSYKNLYGQPISLQINANLPPESYIVRMSDWSCCYPIRDTFLFRVASRCLLRKQLIAIQSL